MFQSEKHNILKKKEIAQNNGFPYFCLHVHVLGFFLFVFLIKLSYMRSV